MVPKFEYRLIIIMEQGETAGKAFNATTGTIDNITIPIVFSYCKSKPFREIAKEQ